VSASKQVSLLLITSLSFAVGFDGTAADDDISYRKWFEIHVVVVTVQTELTSLPSIKTLVAFQKRTTERDDPNSNFRTLSL
jgi:hypothetical protein